MNGTPATCTVWVAQYCFTKPARKVKVPGSAKKEDDKVFNSVVISSSDPSGKDCYDIARHLVLGPVPYDGSDFRLLVCTRQCEVMGFVGVTTTEKLAGKAPQTMGEPEKDPEPDPDDGEGGDDDGDPHVVLN